MGLTMFLLGLVYVAFVAVLIAINTPTIFVIIIAGGVLLFQYFYSDKIALRSMRAHEVGREQEPELYGTVERLCAMADMPVPRIAVSELDLPNAFATGRSPKHAVICATRGIMRRLEPNELEGVLSHELSHVAHRDVAVMTIASFMAMAAGLLVRFTMYGEMFGGGWGGGRDNQGGAAAMIMLIMMVSILVYAISFLLIRALSRYRELSADRSGAILTARPSALASALIKVTGDMGRIPTRDLRAHEPMNAFFFAPAVAKGFSLSSLIATHPPLEKRLDQLSKLEAEMEKPA